MTGDHEYGQQQPECIHLKSRGDSREAAGLVRGILANDDQEAVTAHDYATRAPTATLPDRVRALLDRRVAATSRRQLNYQSWQAQAQDYANSMRQARERYADRSSTRDYGLEL